MTITGGMTTAGKRGASVRGVAGQTLLRARQGHLPVYRQMAEMVVLKLFYGLGPGHYHTARYWRRELPWSFKTGFWPYRKFRAVVSALNPPVYQKMSQHKVCEKAILQLLNIPSPQFRGHLHPARGLTATGTPLKNAADLEQLLLANPHWNKLCFKLVEGFGGMGFQAIRCLREDGLQLQTLDLQKIFSVEEFVADVLNLDSGADYIVEDYIIQHHILAALNTSSVNTLRIWVSCIAGETSLIDAFLRVGRHGSVVDNTSRGAQIFQVDIRTGRIGQGVVKNIYNEVHSRHLDSGDMISGQCLPFWPEALDLAQRAVAAFPAIQFAGVDIAIADSGAVVVELNVEPDPTSAIIFDRCHRELFSGFSGSERPRSGGAGETRQPR